MAATTEVEKWNKEGPRDLPKGMRKEFLSFIKVHDETYRALNASLPRYVHDEVVRRDYCLAIICSPVLTIVDRQ